MAKEYVIERAFKKTVSKQDKTPVTWKNKEGAEFQTWIVKVEEKPFWFQLNKKVENTITPGDTIYGVFDEEEKTNKATGEVFTVNVFNRIQRTDGSRDKVQARESTGSPADVISSGDTKNFEARLKRLEDHLGLPPIEWNNTKQEDEKLDDPENEPFDLNDIPL